MHGVNRVLPARGHAGDEYRLDEALDLRSVAPAVVSPSNVPLHAQADAGVIDARDDLRRALLAFDKARTNKNRGVRIATRRWQPRVGSSWSVLDEFEANGRRFVVAIDSPKPTRPRRRDLSAREYQVLTQAHLGHSDKVIAHTLELSYSTVRVLLHRAAQKLEASTRRDTLVRFAALTKASHPR
jgi:DNA-binding CsgD family transcriptional regulator